MTEYGSLILFNVGHTTPVPTEVLALAWDMMRGVHGAGSGLVRTDQHSL